MQTKINKKAPKVQSIDFNVTQLLFAPEFNQVVLCTGEGSGSDTFTGVALIKGIGHQLPGYISPHWMRKSFVIFNDEVTISND
jgi:hypothetical protein